jgi:hypothetical protein
MDLLDAVRRRAWDSRFYDLPPEAKAVPTMLSAEEGKMLCWLGEHYFQGQGAIVELGCFLGGSTVRLASGLQRSGQPWTMHSYDRFLIDEPHKHQFLYRAGYEKFDGQDMLPVFEKHAQPFAPNIIAHRGNVEEHPWAPQPIEILFVDLAKSVSTQEFILEQFFTSLIPGRSIIVQQDYLFFHTPWLVAVMELLHPKIELISWARDHSVLFLCNDVPDKADFERARYDRLSQKQVEELFRQARERFPFQWQREMIAVSLDSYLRSPGATSASAFQADWSKLPTLGPWSDPPAANARKSSGFIGRLLARR